MNVKIEDVKAYWEQHPAGYDQIKDLANDPIAFIEERDRITKLASPHIYEKYRMHLVQGLRVLDIGCGQGYNAELLVRSGAILTAVDLTNKAMELAKTRFQIRGLKADFIRVNVESLPFADESFDFIHSSGCIHHTPNIEKVVDEMYRVLCKGGRGSIMLYNKASLKFWYKIQFKIRLLMIILYLAPPRLREFLFKKRPHYQMYTPSHFPSSFDVLNAGTDFGGVKNPLSRAFTRKEASCLFSKFLIEGFATSQEIFKPFSHKKSIVEKLISVICEWINERWGWYLYVYIRKEE